MNQSERDRFCTAIYGELETDDARLAHRHRPRPATRAPCSSARTDGGAAGPPGSLLGVFEEIDLTVTSARLDAGDVVILYTDGITDLPPPHGRTEHDVADLAARVVPGRTAAQIAADIHDSVVERLGNDERNDDVALVVLRVC